MTTNSTAPVPPDASGLREMRERLVERKREWLWNEATDDTLAGWGYHMDQMLYRLPRDSQTRDMQVSIESMLADLRALLAASEAAPTADEREAAASVIASLRARLDAVSDLADRLVGNEAAPLIREALNGYVATDELKCEGRTPSNCGNPSCPVHSTPATPPADDASEVEARDWVRRVLTDERFGGTYERREELVDVLASRLARESAAATRAEEQRDHLLHRLSEAQAERDEWQDAATRARAEGAVEALREAADVITETRSRGGYVDHQTAAHIDRWLRDRAASIARSDAAPHTGAQLVNWDSPTWGGGVHHATTDDLGDHGRHSDETEQ